MRRFWIILYAATAAAQVPFAIALGYLLALARVPGAPAIAIGAAVVVVVLLRGRIRRARDDRHQPRWRMLLVEEPYFTHWGATVLALPIFAVGAMINSVTVLAGAATTGSFGAVALAAYAASLLVASWAVVVRRRWVRVRTLDIAIEGLGAAFEGYRIAQLSDLHIGLMCPRQRAERWRERVNGFGVDLVALTGDYVTSGVAFHNDIAAVLTGFAARDGTVAVMGNHDYFGDGEPLISLLREGGVRVLRNEHVTIERDGHRLTLAGVDDTWTRRADVGRALEGRDEDLPLVVLAHDPKLFPEIVKGGGDLVLSGHTHWGQVAVPFFATRYNLSRLSFRFHSGLYRDGRATLYVNPGLGTTGPPVRLGSPPEITILRLRCA